MHGWPHMTFTLILTSTGAAVWQELASGHTLLVWAQNGELIG